jgi:hypothetical protein
MQASRQTETRLLCFECEQLFREKGENWVIPQLAPEIAEGSIHRRPRPSFVMDNAADIKKKFRAHTNPR